MTGSLARVAVLMSLVASSLAVALPASAHGEDETTQGYLLIQQALGHLAHDTSQDGVDLAMEKVKDALETDDQEGLDVPAVQRGMAALEAGHVDRARALLQASIHEAITKLPPATGNQTGTHAIAPELEGRPGLRVQDWALLAGSFVVLLLGVWLTFLFRPHDTTRELQVRLTSAPVKRPEVRKGD